MSNIILPERFEMEPYQTVDKGSTNYKAGFNACLDEVARLNPYRARAVPNLVECDRCPTSGGCVEVCMRAQQKEG